MSQIGKLQAALASATNEVTVAAANINFDFCLVKYDAPKEYQPIGALLSTQRKQDAESGSSHVTARRLTALFNGVCPDTPNLLKAYGQRVSDISTTASSQESTDFANSMFAPYSGIDATSIWAAATSAEPAHGSALHVHLLASMLAKMWDPPEAISIWDQLVKERRRMIAEQLEKGDSLPFSLATAAAQQDISRAQLAAWDASARAWLQTANAIMEKQQTQLRLILGNIELPISSGTNVYSGVTEAWIKALTVMERLISGTPQEIHDGAALLGLAAWHIYPDIQVFGAKAKTTDVPMRDSLVKPGGVLILGCATSASTPMSGIAWSLSLENLRFYGGPVESQASVQSDPDHVSFDELMLATLGRILTLWGLSWEEILPLSQILPALALRMRQDSVDAWLIQGIDHLAQAVNTYLREPTISSPFVNLGMNRPDFITDKTEDRNQKPIRPVFFLHEIELLSKLKDSEARILFLRRLAGRFLNQNPNLPECIIRCHDPGKTVEWASVFPGNYSKRGASRQGLQHARWDSSDPAACRTEVHYQNSTQARIQYFDQPPFVQKHQGGHVTSMTEWYGDPQLAAIYVEHIPTQPAMSRPRLALEDLLWALENNLLLPLPPKDEVRLTLEFLAMSYSTVFKYISSPVIRLQTFLRPLRQAEWTTLINERYTAFTIQANLLQQQFSVLSYFVSDHNVAPKNIPVNVCGISIGDSLFVPKKLLCDPIATSDDGGVVRVLGNIGRPGFVMFSGVKQPIVSSPSETSWRVINKNKFDGRREDCFRSTSLHLSFTNWERYMAEPDSTGKQDAQLIRLESVISIRDTGKWIGDVDVLRALQDENIFRLPPQSTCTHRKDEPFTVQMTSIESWDELREARMGNVVVRAHGNWVARLAIASFLSQGVKRGDFQINNIIICPKEVCWKCIESFPACVYIF